MYKAFFGLRANPFNVNPDPRFLFHTPYTEEALACLTYGIQNRKGFVLLTGEVGTGKTTLIQKLMEWLKLQRVSTAFLFNPKMNVSEFFDYMLTDFGIPSQSSNKSQTLIRLNSWLLERYQLGETAVLIIDEAQNLSDELLEEIRLLTNLETASEKLLQILLVGQPELEQKLKQPHLRQLRQRITVKARTQALSLEETHSYILRRLAIAGAKTSDVFLPHAVELIQAHSKGIPRIINVICEHCLITSFVDGNLQIAAEVVQKVAEDLDLVPSEVHAPTTSQRTSSSKIDLFDALKIVAEQLRQIESAVPQGRKA